MERREHKVREAATIQRPRPLRRGDTIALVAPAGTFLGSDVLRFVSILENRGYRVRMGRAVFNQHRSMAGRDEDRAGDLLWAFLSKEIDAIFCIRGGFGSSRILPWLWFPSLPVPPKIFLGFSDVTFLHGAIWRGARWVTFHGPTALNLVDHADRLDAVLERLASPEHFQWHFNPYQVLRHGCAEGPLLGGNLTCISHLLGTPYAPRYEDSILFLEDCNEAPYRIDRLLCHLKLAGILTSLRALILGDFIECGSKEELDTIFEEYAKNVPGPVVRGLPCGHGEMNRTLPHGCPVRIDTGEGLLRSTLEPLMQA